MSLFIESGQKILYSILFYCSVSLLNFCNAAALILTTVFYLLQQVALSFVGTSRGMIGLTAHTTVSVVLYNQKFIRVISPLSGGDC